MKDEKQSWIRSTLVGLCFACCGAGFIWGVGGVLLVMGVFVIVTSCVEYWRTP